ncbi:MAG: YbaK/EbsC family protein [Spirochaetaceae bacterium]|jgi:prolyl-tRNA editing enzyme YbaK/EbsC (Cys-tRNA(Pro) deacylase)|nr:YbaK/EbsC family protein [Spirochaetaceae bacterium]
MSIHNAQEYLNKWGKGNAILEREASTATVSEAASALGVEEARIAKSISFKKEKEDGALMIVCAGDVKIDNKKFKDYFGYKARMLHGDEVLQYTGHEPGGVCPFGIPEGANTEVYLDESLHRFSTVFPACGSANSCIELTCPELEEISCSKAWIDVCKEIEE